MHRSRTRVLNACQRCRRQKAKCSGTHPCQACHKRGLHCDFGARDKQVMVSERELFDLRNQLEQSERRNLVGQHALPSAENVSNHLGREDYRTSIVDISQGPSNQGGVISEHVRAISGGVPSNSPTSPDDLVHSEVPNLLVPERPAYVSEISGELRHLGHSSNYAFTQQVLQVLQHNIPSNPSPEILLSSDGKVYKAESSRLAPLPSPDISRLPSKSIALHYLQCVKFRTQPLFYLFDEFEFDSQLQSFYEEPYTYAQTNLICFTHYLVLMALGRALDFNASINTISGVEVSEYFTRALQLLPDMAYLCHRPTEAAELFCCIALYLQSIDHRRAAVVYAGQAIRMAQLDALHLDLQESVVGSCGVERGRRVWWTVYTLNQRLTSNIGLPNGLKDADIASPTPKVVAGDEEVTAFALHVRVCQLLGIAITNIYSSSGTLYSSFVPGTCTVLKIAAEIADDLKQYSKTSFGDVSRVAAHLELAYHQCVILACRPALFYLLKVQSSSRQGQQTSKVPRSIKGVIQVCIDCAIQAVATLSLLKEYDLLDIFLPFDLECAFSAAFVLVIAIAIYPEALPNEQSVWLAKEVIETIATRGSAQANLRKLEVQELEDLLASRFHDTRQTGDIQTPNNNSFVATLSEQPESTLFFDGWYFDTGLSGNQILNLADALDAEQFDGFM